MRREIRVRNVTWKDYGISTNLQKELKAFCLQYGEKKKRGILLTDCEMIESAAEETSPQLGKYRLKSVTKDLSYEQLEYDTQYGRIPVGKTDFYGYRRKFFFILYQKKIGDKQNTRSKYNEVRQKELT